MSQPRPAAFIVYVSSSGSRQIHSFWMDAASGSLTPLEVTLVPGKGDASRGNMPLALSRDGSMLYAELRDDPYPLSAFMIEPRSGSLRLVQTVPLPAPMAYIATSKDGRFLLGASYDHAALAVHAIDANGRVAVPSVQTVRTPPKAHCVVPAPFGGFVYATSVDGNAVLVYRFDAATGRLDPAESPSVAARPHAGPRHLAFHPTLDVLYCVNEHAGSLAAYSVRRSTGALTEVQVESLVPADYSGNAMAADIHVTPDGSLVYASVRKTNTITGFRIDPDTGLLTRAGTFEVEAFPRGFAIDPQGRFLLCAGQESDALAVHAIESGTGTLRLLTRYPVGKRPSWIEILPAAQDE